LLFHRQQVLKQLFQLRHSFHMVVRQVTRRDPPTGSVTVDRSVGRWHAKVLVPFMLDEGLQPDVREIARVEGGTRASISSPVPTMQM
jgi:hypothetical protein